MPSRQPRTGARIGRELCKAWGPSASGSVCEAKWSGAKRSGAKRSDITEAASGFVVALAAIVICVMICCLCGDRAAKKSWFPTQRYYSIYT